MQCARKLAVVIFLTFSLCCKAKAEETSTASGSMSPEDAYMQLRVSSAKKLIESMGAHAKSIAEVRARTARKPLVLVNKSTQTDGSVEMIFKAAEKDDPLVVTAIMRKDRGNWVVGSESMSHEGNSPREKNDMQAAAIALRSEKAALIDSTARQNFVSTPLAGMLQGIRFAPTLCSSAAYADPQYGGYRNRLHFVDVKNGQDVQLEVCILPKPYDVQGAINNARTGVRANLTVRVNNSVSTGGQFGLKVNLGKITNNKMPLYIIFKMDKDNWFQGYALCNFETAKL